MTIYSAREQLKGIENPRGSHNQFIGDLLRNFFGVEPQVNDDPKAPALTKFTEFGGSPQRYFPDVPYDFSEQVRDCSSPDNHAPLTNGNFRLSELLYQASELGCLVLYSMRNGAHVAGLAEIDPGDDNFAQRYVIRNPGEGETDPIDRIYEPGT